MRGTRVVYVVGGLLVLAGLIAVGIWAVSMLRLSHDMRHVEQVIIDGDHQRLATLIDRGLDVNALMPSIEGPPRSRLLATTAGEDDAKMIQLLLEAGADVNAADEWGWTPLIHATIAGRQSNVRLLLEAGADTEATWHKRTALMHAAGGLCPDSVRMVRDLLGAGADASFTSETGRNVLHDAAYGHLPVKLLRELVDRGADPTAVTESGQTALHSAIQWIDPAVPKIVEFLIAQGTPVDQADNRGITALHLAAEQSAGAVRLLLEAGADLHALDDYGWSALHHAARYGSAESVRLLLEAGVDPMAIVTDPNIGSMVNVVDLAHSDLGSIVAAPEDVKRKIRLLEEALAAAEEKDTDGENR